VAHGTRGWRDTWLKVGSYGSPCATPGAAGPAAGRAASPVTHAGDRTGSLSVRNAEDLAR